MAKNGVDRVKSLHCAAKKWSKIENPRDFWPKILQLLVARDPAHHLDSHLFLETPELCGKIFNLDRIWLKLIFDFCSFLGKLYEAPATPPYGGLFRRFFAQVRVREISAKFCGRARSSLVQLS